MAPSEAGAPAHRTILGARVDALTVHSATDRVLAWSRAGESRYVCVATVNNVMTGRADPEFRRIHNGADLVTSDGMPLLWGLRLLGLPEGERVVGMDLTLRICAAAARDGVPVAFLGGAPEVLARLTANLQARYPALRIAYAWSPPFRPLTEEEDRAVVADVKASGARILFVGIGCPKQERWMAAHRGVIPAVMLGVGAAFDFIAGSKPVAPDWMKRLGLEWLFRLATEPGRLWRRYLLQNPVFIALFTAQVIRARRGGARTAA